MLIQLVAVQYDAGTEICVAPFDAIKAGDTVQTRFGTGKVAEIETISSNNDVYCFMKKYSPLSRVEMVCLNYEEVDE